MMNRKNTNYRSLFAFLLLFEFACILANNFFFLHVHVLQNGTYVYHAHPYKKGNELPGKQHQHTSFELMLTDHQAGNYIVPDTPVDIIIYKSGYLTFQEPLLVNYKFDTPFNIGQRAPPFFVI